MRPFAYERAGDAALAARHATAQGQTDAPVQFLAGGTTLIDLMKLDVLRPDRVVDITPLKAAHGAIEVGPSGLRLGALATMSAVADHPQVIRDYPAIAQSMALAASPQLRNMATLGGNVLQRTRCPYYRDPSWGECNKRKPDSGCAAIKGFNRQNAVLGVSDQCIAQYPSDFGVVLAGAGGGDRGGRSRWDTANAVPCVAPRCEPTSPGAYPPSGRGDPGVPRPRRRAGPSLALSEDPRPAVV
jgi:xanthine dehydrogenase YagS FAD-binding subunit